MKYTTIGATLNNEFTIENGAKAIEYRNVQRATELHRDLLISKYNVVLSFWSTVILAVFTTIEFSKSKKKPRR